MSRQSETLTTEEQKFLFEVVFPGLDERRDDLDRDLFSLLAVRLLNAGYTLENLTKFLSIADKSIRRN